MDRMVSNAMRTFMDDSVAFKIEEEKRGILRMIDITDRYTMLYVTRLIGISTKPSNGLQSHCSNSNEFLKSVAHAHLGRT